MPSKIKSNTTTSVKKITKLTNDIDNPAPVITIKGNISTVELAKISWDWAKIQKHQTENNGISLEITPNRIDEFKIQSGVDSKRSLSDLDVRYKKYDSNFIPSSQIRKSNNHVLLKRSQTSYQLRSSPKLCNGKKIKTYDPEEIRKYIKEQKLKRNAAGTVKDNKSLKNGVDKHEIAQRLIQLDIDRKKRLKKNVAKGKRFEDVTNVMKNESKLSKVEEEKKPKEEGLKKLVKFKIMHIHLYLLEI